MKITLHGNVFEDGPTPLYANTFSSVNRSFESGAVRSTLPCHYMSHSPERKGVNMELKELELEELGKTFSQTSVRLPTIQSQISKVRGQNNSQVCSSHEIKKGNGDPLGFLCEDEQDEENDSSSVVSCYAERASYIPQAGYLNNKYQRSANNGQAAKLCKSEYLKMSPPQKDDQPRRIYRVEMPEQQRNILRFSRYYYDQQGECQGDSTCQASEGSNVSTKARQPKEPRGNPPGPGQASNRRYSYQQMDCPSFERYHARPIQK